MKLSISNIAWNENDDNEVYSYLKMSNFDGIEIAPTRFFITNPYNHINEMIEIESKLEEKYGLKISSMQSILFGCKDQLFGSNEERLNMKNYLIKAINFASAIDCHNLVFGSPKNRIIQKLDDRRIAVEFFKQIGDYASSMNTVLSIEANPKIYGSNFLNYTMDAIDFVNEVNSSGFMLNLDFGTIIENNEQIDQVLNSIHLINHIHISEPNLDIIKKRSEHDFFFKKLNSLNYQNYVSIEMKSTGDLNEVKNAINYVKEVSKWKED